MAWRTSKRVTRRAKRAGRPSAPQAARWLNMMAERRSSAGGQSLTTIEADALTAADPVAVLPLAAIEQHGPHLPLSTDLDIGLGLIAEAFRRLRPRLPRPGASPPGGGVQPGARALRGHAVRGARAARRADRGGRGRNGRRRRPAAGAQQQPRRQPPCDGRRGAPPSRRARHAGGEGQLVPLPSSGRRQPHGRRVAPRAARRGRSRPR